MNIMLHCNCKDCYFAHFLAFSVSWLVSWGLFTKEGALFFLQRSSEQKIVLCDYMQWGLKRISVTYLNSNESLLQNIIEQLNTKKN